MSNSVTYDLAAAVDPGPNHFWDVSFDKRSNKTPIRVSLMARIRPGTTILAEEIGWERTIAVEDKVREAAELVLVRVADRARFLGVHEPVGEPSVSGSES